MPFRTLHLAIIIERQNKLNFSNQCQTKFFLPKSKNEFYDLLPIPSCTSWSSSTKTKVKDMENMLIFHVTTRIQILTTFSVQSKYSKKTKSISLLGFVISNRRPDGSVGMALVLPALTDCRWWFESLLVHSGVSSATRRKATGADHKKMGFVISNKTCKI